MSVNQAGGGSVAATPSPTGWTVEKSGKRPNILFLMMDQHRFDAIGNMGNVHIETPALDALAGRGTLFSRTYTQGPLCQPARASLLTGAYVKQNGQSWNGFPMNPDWPTITKQLQSIGYTTAMVGKTHFYPTAMFEKRDASPVDLRTKTPWCRRFGFDYLLEEFDHYAHQNPAIVTPYTQYLEGLGLLETYRTELPPSDYGGYGQVGRVSRLPEEHQLSTFVGATAIDWLRGYKSEKPFFLWVSFVEPHPPLTASERWSARYAAENIPTGTRQLPQMADDAWGKYLRFWSNATKNANMTDEEALLMARFYYALVSQTDSMLGKVVNVLEETGHDRDTWIFYTSDHGEMLGNHNLVFKLVFYQDAVRVPNIVVPPGGMPPRRVDDLVEAIDISATMLDVAQTNLPSCQGRSLLSSMRGERHKREAAFSELAGTRNKDNYFVMVATPRYRYVYDKETRTPCELFDLANDPCELVNLVKEQSHQGVREDLHRDYIELFTRS